jgi:NADH:ubiquinone oxidoreductase subunit E
MIVQVCIGSSCHLKGSREVVELMRKAIADRHLEDEVVLAGSFCLGRCTTAGVSVLVDDQVVCGVTKENFAAFFDKYVINGVSKP